jgi:hypothetical protein
MMGSRGSVNGNECDAFSRGSRRILRWRRGELKKIKRGFAKRIRKTARLQLQTDL